MPVGGCPILTERALYFLEIWIAEPRLGNSIERLKEGREQRSSIVLGKGGGDPNIVAPRTAQRLEYGSHQNAATPTFWTGAGRRRILGLGAGEKSG